MKEWDEIDEQMAREGMAIKGSHQSRHPRNGKTRVPTNRVRSDYRVRNRSRNLLSKLNVINGKPTKCEENLRSQE